MALNWRKALFTVWATLSIVWCIVILVHNYNRSTSQTILAPDNATISQSIKYWREFRLSKINTANNNSNNSTNQLSLPDNLLTITYDPLSLYIELHGYDTSVSTPIASNKRIVLPAKYVGYDDSSTLNDIVINFAKLEKERNSYLFNETIIQIAWPVLFSAIIFYMSAWIIFHFLQSKRKQDN